MSVTSIIFFNEKLCKGCLFIIFYFLVLTLDLDAQPENWTIRYYSTEEGLSSNHINCILKDSKGFIWAGADNGLNRFDGYSFSLPGPVSGESHPLSGVQILSMIEDRDSVLWIGTSDGLFRYNTSEPISEIRHYNYLPTKEGQSYRMSQPVNELCEDKNGLLWMSCIDIGEGVNYGLWTFNKTSGTFSYVIPDSTYAFRGEGIPVVGYIGSVYSDRNGDLSNNIELVAFECRGNALTGLDISKYEILNHWLTGGISCDFGPCEYGLSIKDMQSLR